jgi:GT2 family glycosyltransferase
MAKSLVSVIVLNFNGKDHLEMCLSSLLEQTYEPCEIIVADNGSVDSSREIVAKYAVRWEPLKKNHGFARGNNLAAARAEGEILLFVNNDMRFHPEFVANLVGGLEMSSDVFASDAQQFDWSGEQAIHQATQLVRLSLRDWARAGDLLPTATMKQVASTVPIDVVQACAGNMAVRRSMFDQLGGFDERLPAGWEDTEICWRAWLRGWRTVYVPQAVTWHKVGAASRTPEGRVVRYRGSVGGRVHFATKHLPMKDAAAVWAVSFAGLVCDVVTLNWAQSVRRASVLAEWISWVPAILRERRHLYSTVGRSPSEHFSALLALGSSPKEVPQ